jgi:hypothetical protein
MNTAINVADRELNEAELDAVSGGGGNLAGGWDLVSTKSGGGGGVGGGGDAGPAIAAWNTLLQNYGF